MTPKNVNCRKTILGKYEVTYDCPGCGKSLKNDLEDAGKDDQCPHCECEFVVPGSGYKRDLERRRAERIAEKDAAKKEIERQASEARENDKARLEAIENRSKPVETPKGSEPTSNRTSIQYISEGLADLVHALFHSFLSGIFGSVTLVCASLSQSGDRDGLLVLALIFGAITVGFVLSFFVAINESIDSFRKGAKS